MAIGKGAAVNTCDVSAPCNGVNALGATPKGEAQGRRIILHRCKSGSAGALCCAAASPKLRVTVLAITVERVHFQPVYLTLGTESRD